MEKQIIIADRYRVIRKIGEGGMAKVYLAYDSKLDFNVALKILKKENVNDKKVRNFKREALALSLMDDENIVKVFDVGEEGNIHYIATEFVDGMTLKEYIVSCSPIPIDEVVDLSMQVLKGIAHAHQKNVVHKDIKSQNILLDENRNVKITDFGIANIMDDDSTKTQSLMGTPQYVAPEILNREALTEQSDIYSIGIMMYEMLIGKAPFTGEKPAVIMIKQMNHPLPSIISDRVDVPQGLENIIIRMTAKRLDNRYKTANDAIYDLERVFENARIFEEKLVLENDVLNHDKLDKTISLDGELNLNKLKSESDRIQKNSKRRKILISIFLMLLIILAIGVKVTSEPEMKMPDLVSKDVDYGTDQLLLLGIDESNIEVEYSFSEDADEGTILSTTPAAEESITTEDLFVLEVSQGTEKVILEDVTNMMESEVTPQLESEGYVVNKEYIDDPAPAGTIISQDPLPGTSNEVNATVTLKISTGNYLIPVANFSNLTIEYVEEWAAPHDITVEQKTECNNSFEEGRVYNQDPTFGTEIENGSTVTVFISEGACEIPEVVVPPAEEPAETTEQADSTTNDQTDTETTQ